MDLIDSSNSLQESESIFLKIIDYYINFCFVFFKNPHKLLQLAIKTFISIPRAQFYAPIFFQSAVGSCNTRYKYTSHLFVKGIIYLFNCINYMCDKMMTGFTFPPSALYSFSLTSSRRARPKSVILMWLGDLTRTFRAARSRWTSLRSSRYIIPYNTHMDTQTAIIFEWGHKYNTTICRLNCALVYRNPHKHSHASVSPFRHHHLSSSSSSLSSQPPSRPH